MTDVASEVLSVANEVAPEAPIVEVANAAVATVADLGPSTVLSDIELAVSLITQLKTIVSNVSGDTLDKIKTLVEDLF